MSELAEVAAEVIASAITSFQANKGWADKAIAQLPDDKLRVPLDDHTNSVAVIMKHVAGNLKSRWTDFLTTDGEKPWRNRDDEFVDAFASRQEVLDYWDEGWSCLFETLRSLQPEDLSKTVTIRGEPHSVPLAIHRSLAHCGYHVGQIMMLARHLAGDDWTTITVPRGQLGSYNQSVWGKDEFRKLGEEDQEDGINVLFSTDGQGNWWRREWVRQCPAKILILDRCQGVEGHEGDHWCFRKDGSYAWSRDENHPDFENGASGWTPPDHPDYRTPIQMQPQHFLSHYTDSQISDPAEIARLEREETREGESINRPCTAEEIEALQRRGRIPPR